MPWWHLCWQLSRQQWISWKKEYLTGYSVVLYSNKKIKVVFPSKEFSRPLALPASAIGLPRGSDAPITTTITAIGAIASKSAKGRGTSVVLNWASTVSSVTAWRTFIYQSWNIFEMELMLGKPYPCHHSYRKGRYQHHLKSPPWQRQTRRSRDRWARKWNQSLECIDWN